MATVGTRKVVKLKVGINGHFNAARHVKFLNPVKNLVEIITLTDCGSRNYSADGAHPGMTFNHHNIQRFPTYQPITPATMMMHNLCLSS